MIPRCARPWRLPAPALTLLLLLSLSGCDSLLERTSWNSSGTFTAHYTDPSDRTSTLSNRLLSPAGGITTDRRVRLDDIDHLSFSLGYAAGGEQGVLVGLRARFDGSLGETGRFTVIQGEVIASGPKPGEPEVTISVVDPGWSVTGILEVYEHAVVGDPPDSVGQTVTVETARGAFELEATHPDGRSISLQGGQFRFGVEAYRYVFEP